MPHVHLITSFIRYLYNVTQWAVLDMRMGRFGLVFSSIGAVLVGSRLYQCIKII